MSKYTANTAAAQTRAEIKRHIARLRKAYGVIDAKIILDSLVDFINGMAKRAGKRTGGLGRK